MFRFFPLDISKLPTIELVSQSHEKFDLVTQIKHNRVRCSSNFKA